MVVTGGTRGLGCHISVEFARHGYRVLALYRSDVVAAEQLDRIFNEEGLLGRTFRHDVAARASEKGPWVQPEVADASSIVLIHNASAPFEPTPLHLLRWQDFAVGLDVSLKGLWLCTLGVLRPMLSKGGGTIVSVLTSGLSAEAPKGFGAYLAAKAAQQAFTRSIAAEYGGRGVRALTVSPGFMATPLTDAWHPSLRKAMLQRSNVSDPATVAGRIRVLVEDPAVRGSGENYDL